MALLDSVHDFKETYEFQPGTKMGGPLWVDVVNGIHGSIYGKSYVGDRELLRG